MQEPIRLTYTIYREDRDTNHKFAIVHGGPTGVVTRHFDTVDELGEYFKRDVQNTMHVDGAGHLIAPGILTAPGSGTHHADGTFTPDDGTQA